MANNRPIPPTPRTTCPACGNTFEATKHGAHAKQFCSIACKSKRDRAYRNYARHAIANEHITLEQLIKDHA